MESEKTTQHLESENTLLRIRMETLQNDFDALKAEHEELTALYCKTAEEYAKLSSDHIQILSSTSWKLMSPIRKCGIAAKQNRLTYRCGKGLKLLFTRGPKAVIAKMRPQKKVNKAVASFTISKKQREEERATVFEKDITISILVPLYNTPLNFLKEMIASVQNQTYSKWELCLADGSDDEHPEVGETVRALAEADPRIVYTKLERNLGISDNTNACIDISSGEYISLFDHDDLLHPSALFHVMKAICEQDADFIYTDEITFLKNDTSNVVNAHFKADFAPDTLRSYNYICHLTTFSRELMNKAGTFRAECDGSQDYDIILRLTEQAQKIVHIPKILYFWRGHENSTAQDITSKPYIVNAAHKALSDHLERQGIAGTVTDSSIPSTYRIRYDIEGEPLVSILIPNKDQVSTLDTCIRSIYEKTTYKNFEVIIIENNSTQDATFRYYRSLEDVHNNLKVVTWKQGFNYSAINNFGFKEAKGDFVLLLNNDIEVITPDWIQEMVMFAQRKDVGAVGAMLYYPDDTIQHAGVILGIGGVAGHSHKYYQRGSYGYMSRATIAQNLTAVTFACVMMRREVFEEVEGLDEAFQVAFNDVDMCMRIRKAGYLIVFTPYAELYHHESKSRGSEDTPEKVKRFNSEVERFQGRWGKELADGDPYYNPNLTLIHEDFSFKD